MKPHVLYTSFRRHDGIYAWDLRGDTSTPVLVLQHGKSESNQKIKFDVDIGGKWMGVGDEVRAVFQIQTSRLTPIKAGKIHLFDLDETPAEEEDRGPTRVQPVMSYSAHEGRR